MKRRTSPDSPLLFEEVPLVPDFRLELKARKAGHWPSRAPMRPDADHWQALSLLRP